MAMDVMLLKQPNGMLAPADQQAVESVQRLKIGQPLGCTLTQLRKAKFHRKLFALFNFVFENVELPEVEHNGEMVRQSRTTHRRTLVIRAGHYTHDVMANGMLTLRAKSVSYANCSQEEVEQIYGDVLDVVAKDLASMGYDRDRLESLTEEWLRFS